MLGWAEVDDPIEVLNLIRLLSVVVFPAAAPALLKRAGMAPTEKPSVEPGVADQPTMAM